MTRARGYTLTELLVSIGIVGVVLALAVPSFDVFVQRRRVEGQSAQFMADLQAVKAATAARAEGLRLSFHPRAGTVPTPSDTTSGYLIHTGPIGACACVQGQPQCGEGTTLVRGACLSTGPLQIRANVGSLLFDPRQSTVSPTGSVDISSPTGGTLRHVINIMGRMRVCSVQGRFQGTPSC